MTTKKKAMPRAKEKIANRYELVKEIGRGSFSKVYLAIDTRDGKKYALKYESARRQKNPRLVHESKIYNLLRGKSGIATMEWIGHHGADTVMALQLLGPSLDSLFEKRKKRFTMRTVIMLGDRMLRRIESLHDCGYIHRDIKPANFAVGRGSDSGQVYLIDFGLAKPFTDAHGNHIPIIHGKKFVGTPRYGSINAHRGIELSRRDDIESIGYVLIYFYHGCLPWHGAGNGDKEERNRIILRLKKEWKHQLLDNVPRPIRKMMQYAHQLEFDEKPNYHMLRGYFRDYAKSERINMDGTFDWDESS